MEGLPSSRPAGFRGCSQVPEKPHFSQGQLKGPPSAPGENQWRFQLFNQRQSPESIRALADRLLPGSRSEPLAFEGGGGRTEPPECSSRSTRPGPSSTLLYVGKAIIPSLRLQCACRHTILIEFGRSQTRISSREDYKLS